jgi:hypothetical protein
LTDTYTLSDLAAMKSKPYTYGGFEWSNVGTIPEAAWETVPEPAPPKCPHCSRDWHTAPLTKRVADMVRNHRFDPTYKAAEDESPVECVGSDVYGHNRPVEAWGSSYGGITGLTGTFLGVEPGAPWLNELITATITWTTDMAWTAIVGGGGGGGSWGFQQKPWVTLYDEAYQPLTPSCPPDLELDVQFGPEHWPIERQRLHKLSHRELVRKVHPTDWRETIPLPASPGRDVSTLVEEFNKKHNWKGFDK